MQVALLVNSQLAAIRDWLRSNEYVEVVTPVLHAARPIPYRDNFAVTAPNGGQGFSLAGCVTLDGAPVELTRMYALGPAFRPDDLDRDNLLQEFHYLLIRGQGSVTDARRVAQDLLFHVISEVCRSGSGLTIERIEDLRRVSASSSWTLSEVSYDRASAMVGRESKTLSLADQLELAQEHDELPVLITDLDPSANPAWVDVKRNPSGSMRAFEVVLPFAGETLVGGEFESSADDLRERTRNDEATAELERTGVGYDEYTSGILDSTLTGRGQEMFVAVGMERLSQYLLGVEHIQDAVLIQVQPLSFACK
jgi:aspartyl/asparaginyl-tRNA synthetase